MIVAVTVAGCYHPSAETGAPCAANGACPAAQVCDTQQQPPRCVAGLGGDAGPPDARAIDAPIPDCTTSADCGPSAPVCDPSIKVCRGCTADAECTAGVCLEYVGQCTPSAAAIYVSPSGMDTGTCALDQPCATLGFAVQQLGVARRVIRVGDGSYGATGAPVLRIPNLGLGRIVVSGERGSATGALLTAASDGVTNPAVVQTDTSTDVVIEGLTIHDGGSSGMRPGGGVTLYRVAIVGNAARGIDANSMQTGAVHIWESRISGNGSDGIAFGGQSGSLEVLRSEISHNAGGGAYIQKGAATIVDSLVVKNGSSSSFYGGLRYQNLNGLPQVLQFDTIADNHSGTSPAGVFADNNLSLAVDDCILAGNNADTSPQICAQCTATFSLFVGAAPVGSFSGAPAFVDPATDDYHLRPTSAARGQADPNATLRLDIDGEPRPQGAFDIGADEIP